MKLEIDIPSILYQEAKGTGYILVTKLEIAWKAIADGKPLEQEPKIGHWIEEVNDLEGEVRFTCSSCGNYQLFGTDFCYHCGAKMVEPQESEEQTDD